MRKILCSLLLFLCACGYTPVYAPESAPGTGSTGAMTMHKMSSVYIMPLSERVGQKLRNTLLDRGFGDNASAPYVLTLNNLAVTEFDLGISSDNTATRRQLNLQGVMVLTKDGQVVANRTVIARAPYNVLISQYATIVARDNAEEQAVADLARQIETNTALLLRSAP